MSGESNLSFEEQGRRAHERRIALAELRQLEERLVACYHRENVIHQRKCKPLAEEYLRRTKWPEYLPPVGYKDSTVRLRTVREGDDSELVWCDDVARMPQE